MIDQLEVKLPRDLARKLMLISIKLSTGYCSPYPVKELEEAIKALPDAHRKNFEKEWDMVREHKHWPRMPRRDDEKAREGKPATPGAEKKSSYPATRRLYRLAGAQF